MTTCAHLSYYLSNFRRLSEYELAGNEIFLWHDDNLIRKVFHGGNHS